MSDGKLTEGDRFRIRSILLELEAPYEEFHVYDRLCDNNDLRSEHAAILSALSDDALLARLPRLDVEKVMRLPYWSLEEGVSIAVGWPEPVMTVPQDAFIPPPFDGDTDELGLETAKERFDDLLEIGVRAQDLGQLQEKIRPAEFAQWAANKLSWKNPIIESLADAAGLTTRALTKGQRQFDQEMDARSRRTALILIYHLARSFGWHPNKNDDAVGKLVRLIEAAAERKGDASLNISDRTVRAWLNDAKKLIDGND